jgi:hypothetical protein
MKILFIILLSGFSLIAYTQSLSKLTAWQNWAIDDNKELIWRKVQTDSSTAEDIIRQLKSYGWCRDVELRDGVIFARAIDFRLDYKKYKGSSALPYIYKTGKWNFGITVNYKADKYRVVISTITYDAGSVEGGFGLEIPIAGRYDEVALKKQRDYFKASQLEPLSLFGEELTQLFTFKKSVQQSDW